jgi:6,7-dimethyl-8-ribityllumazine synthase
MAERHFALVVGRFYEDLAARLVEGARGALEEAGATAVDVYDVPGAFELPLAAKYAAESGRYDAIVALGAVIRGETPHFDFVAGEASRGLAEACADFDVPVGFGLLTTDTMEQAEARAGGAFGNKGWDAALAALEMVDLFERLRARES